MAGRAADLKAVPVRGMRLSLPSWRLVLPMVLSVLAGLAAWQLAAMYLGMPRYVLPEPIAVWHALIDGLATHPSSRASFWYHLAETLRATFFGFVIGGAIGIVVGAAMAEFRVVERALLPYFVGLQSLPKIAIAPLLIIWFGYQIESKVAMSAILTLFPVLLNSIEGFKSIERERLELMISLKATRWQTFRLVKLPSALPFVFTGLNLGIVYAQLGTIVAEFLGAQRGMGVLITQLQTVSDTAGVFATLVVLAITGFALITIMRTIHRQVVFWTRDSGREAVA